MKRIILAVVCILAVGTLIGGNIYWNQKVDATSQKAKQSLNKGQSNSSTKSPTSSTNSESETSPNSTESTSNSKASNSETSSNSKEPTTNSNEKNSTETNKDSEDKTSPNTNGDKKKTVAEIKNKYNKVFQELEAQETSKIDQLVVQAKADYVSKKSTKTEIVAKYQAVSQQLEAKADQSFNIIYQQLQYDLEKNGHNLNEAQEFQQTYNAKKESRVNRVASEIQGF